MKTLIVAGIGFSFLGAGLFAQTVPNTVDAHIAAAKAAAGTEHFDYSVEDEIVGGLTTLGLDPKNIK